MPFTVHSSIRSGRALSELCDTLSASLGWPPFRVEGESARLEGDGFSLELTRQPLDPARDRRGSIKAALRTDDLALAQNWKRALDALHEPPRYRFEDHWHLHSPLDLEAFCAFLRDRLALPTFEEDAKNETEWALSENENVLVHVAHAFARDLYHEGQPERCPPGCDYWVVVKVKAHSPEARDAAWREREWLPAWDAVVVELGRGKAYRDGRWL